MSINLSKGQKISLSKDSEGNNIALEKIVVGLGWDAIKKRGFFGGGQDIDCDASAILLTDGKLAKSDDIVYYGHLTHSSGAVQHCGDNLTGDGDGDDEQIIVDLNAIPPQYDRIVFVVNIYRAEAKKQDFGLIENAFMRIVNDKTGAELARFNLSEDYKGKTAMIFGEVYRKNGEWKMNAIGQGTNDGSLSELAKRY